MALSFSLFSGFRSDSTVPAGSLLKASSVGANTVKGPLPFRVSARPAACSAAAKVLKVPAATAVSTMSFCAEPATAGIATVRTLRINAKLAAFNLISPYFLVLSVFCCTLALCCFKYREQLLSQYEKQTESGIDVSTSQNSNQRLHWWENEEK